MEQIGHGVLAMIPVCTSTELLQVSDLQQQYPYPTCCYKDRVSTRAEVLMHGDRFSADWCIDVCNVSVSRAAVNP